MTTDKITTADTRTVQNRINDLEQWRTDNFGFLTHRENVHLIEIVREMTRRLQSI